ncbi:MULTISPECIES: radical SAM family heme chaperone HemW [Bacteroidales]|uniref:radical SAM family heme chaperone HemW n=1 Tax=Bacteroidales TaxID=171549 RepID=UPI0005733C0C|nr:radical SAM family heme chaperone HemW [Gabonia massiliensis]KHM46076.1 coproporphyrinogen III oxidase [Coprobacter secundus]
MAGIYIHIPFCKKRCIYCDFFSDTRMHLRKDYVDALCRELDMRYAELENAPVHTIYIGGGTPSQLSGEELVRIFDALSLHLPLSACKEITLEANPDDLKADYITMLKHTPINRISMGIQSFDDDDLLFLNRRHTAAQAEEAFIRCREAGFENISIDLIYGLPGQTIQGWQSNLRRATALRPAHISAYSLIYEEGTALFRMLESGKVSECDDELSLDMFDCLIDTLEAAGYEHYEISNFALPGMYSQHNTSYWLDVPYLGLGPSAHSYDGKCRRWNIKDISGYMNKISHGSNAYETEILDTNSRYNDMILTSLRTMWGLSLRCIEENFGRDMREYCQALAKPYIDTGKLVLSGDNLKLTRSGLFVSDSIMSDLMKVED